MTILFLARLFYPHVGGVETHVYELGKKLIAQGYKLVIVTERFDKSLPLQEKYHGFEIYRLPITTDEKGKKIEIWRWLWQHKELFTSADVIHCHDVFFWYMPFAIIHPMKNVYTTFHGYEGYPIKRKAIVYRKIFEFMSNRTICVGDFMKKWYHANPDRITYGGVNIPKTSRKLIKNSAIFIGRLDDQTGIEMYVQATKLIRRKIPEFTLTVYGDGPYRERIEREGIRIKGFDPAAEKKISKHEFAFVSRYLAILEAMAAKRLVFAVYDNPLKEDYLKMSPFQENIVITDDPKEIAEKVQYYQENPKEAEQKIEAAYQWVRKQTWGEVAAMYEKLWGIEI